MVSFSETVDVEAVAREYKSLPEVEDAQPIGIHRINDIPNDDFFNLQWFLEQTTDVDIDASAAWDIQNGDSSIVVAVLDTGTRIFHKDLGGADATYSASVPNPATIGGNVWRNSAEVSGFPGFDDDANGFADDYFGWDFVEQVIGCWPGEDCSTQDNDPRDFNGHGTHVAGIIVALTNNGYGTAGVAGGFGNGTLQASGDGVRIMPLRIGYSAPYPLNPSREAGFVRMDFAAQALHYAANNGVKLANGSWGSSDTGGLGAAMDAFIASGGIFFHSAGNSNSDSQDYLASRSDVINVAATTEEDQRAGFSNFGPWVDISAPGSDILSLYHVEADPQNDYVAFLSGTSMASPMALGVAALIWSANPNWSAEQVRQHLLATAENIDDQNPDFQGQLGAGRINAVRALASTTPDTDPDIANYLDGANALDIVDGAVPVSNNAPTAFPLGTTVVTFSATDSTGNTGTATATVTVIVADTIPPVVTPPANITVEAEGPSGTPIASPAIAAFLAAATADDLVDGPVVVNNDAPDPFPLGTTTVTFSATDLAGNIGTAQATVTVEDTTEPVVTAPPDYTAEAEGPSGTPIASPAIAAFLAAAEADDLVDGPVVVNNDAPEPFPLGTTTVTFSATDLAGNIGTAQATVTVEDTTEPVVTAPPDYTAEAEGPSGTPIASPAIAAFLAAAEADDLVDGPVVVNNDAPDPFPLGTTTVTFRATDLAGNIGTAQATVTVEDTTSPTITAPANVSVAATGPTTLVSLGSPTVSDLVDPSPAITNDAPPGNRFLVGATVVTWTATDGFGNSASDTQSITIQDDTTPVVTAPENITVAAEAPTGTPATNPTIATFLAAATAVDLVDGPIVVINDAPSVFPLGSTVVTFSATDSAENIGMAQAIVTVGLDTDADNIPNLIDSDDDGDGIFDEIDLDPLVESNEFSDLDLGGTTSGTIVDRGDQILTLRDGSDPVGVLVLSDLLSGPAAAHLSVCTGASTVSLTAGDQISLTCGSVTIEVVTGIVEVEFIASDGRVAAASLEAGDQLTFEPETYSFTVPESSQNSVTILIDGHPYTFPAGLTTLVLYMVIKPGGDSEAIKPINPGSRGVTPVAIPGAETFDPSNIDVSSIGIGPGGAGPVHDGHLEDVNGDGILDLVIHVGTQDLGISTDLEGDSVFPLHLSGMLSDGTLILSAADVIIKPGSSPVPGSSNPQSVPLGQPLNLRTSGTGGLGDGQSDEDDEDSSPGNSGEHRNDSHKGESGNDNTSTNDDRDNDGRGGGDHDGTAGGGGNGKDKGQPRGNGGEGNGGGPPEGRGNGNGNAGGNSNGSSDASGGGSSSAQGNSGDAGNDSGDSSEGGQGGDSDGGNTNAQGNNADTGNDSDSGNSSGGEKGNDAGNRDEKGGNNCDDGDDGGTGNDNDGGDGNGKRKEKGRGKGRN